MGSILKGFNFQSKKRGHRPTLFDRHPGQAIVLIAFLMIVLIGFTGLALDGGELFFLQRNVQNAADAAVLAGLYEICSDPEVPWFLARDQAEEAAEAAINNNGFVDSVPGNLAADGVEILVDGDALYPGYTGPNPPTTGTNYLTVQITANKPARLIQLVYQGPLQVTVNASGSCVQPGPWTDGAALVGVGACGGPGGGGDAVGFSGSQIHITGGVHSNGDVSLGGNAANPSTVTGGVTGSGDVDTGNATTDTSQEGAPQITVPAFWDVDDFRPNGDFGLYAREKGIYFYSSDDISASEDFSDFDEAPGGSGSADPADGIYFADGDITLNSGDIGGKDLNGVTIVATGKISINFGTTLTSLVPYTISQADLEAYPDLPSNRLPVIFTPWVQPGEAPSCGDPDMNNTVTFTGESTFLGVIFAPNGECGLSFSEGGTSNGAIVCYSVDLSGSNYTINYDPDVFPPLPPTLRIVQ